MERRFSNELARIEDRNDGGGKRIVGYAAVYHQPGDAATEYRLGPDIVERIAAGAFDISQDVRALFNHDPSQLLGRTKSGTLRLTSDSRGLRYEIDIPDTSVGRDIAESIKRGDITGSSFGFIPTKATWTRDEQRKVDVRTIDKVDLMDVGPVVFPAYGGATTGLRSGDGQDAERSREEWRSDLERVAVRMRLLTLDDDCD